MTLSREWGDRGETDQQRKEPVLADPLPSRLWKMRAYVHALVEDANDFDASGLVQAVEDDMRADRKLQIALVDVIDCAARSSASRECAAGSDDLTGVVFSLIITPVLGCIAPDAGKICTGGRSEKKAI